MQQIPELPAIELLAEDTDEEVSLAADDPDEDVLGLHRHKYSKTLDEVLLRKLGVTKNERANNRALVKLGVTPSFSPWRASQNRSVTRRPQISAEDVHTGNILINTRFGKSSRDDNRPEEPVQKPDQLTGYLR
jgi:hypothetical protein